MTAEKNGTVEVSEVVVGAKRKLSDATPATPSNEEQNVKKPKLAGREHEPEDISGSPPSPEEGAEEQKKHTKETASETEQQEMGDEEFKSFCERSRRLEGEGPFRFLFYDPGTLEEKNPFPTFFKPEMLKMYAKLNALSEDERNDACDIDNVPIRLDEPEENPDQGMQLKEKLEEIIDGWCKGTFQKDEPEEGSPALRFSLEVGNGHEYYWMTDVKAPDDATRKAIELVSEHVSYGLDGY